MDIAKAFAVKTIDYTQSALEGAKQNVSILRPRILSLRPAASCSSFPLS